MARKFDRFMLDVNVGTNRKLRRLTVPERLCHLAGVLPVAAQAPIRGRLLVGPHDATPSDYADLAGVSVTVARSTVTKLRHIGIIVPDEENGCEMVHDWDDWNPAPKEDKTNAERQRRYRESRKASNGESNGVTEDTVTAVTRNGVTPVREEKRRDEAKASSRRGPEPTPADTFHCRLLADLIVARDPKAKVAPDGERWLTDMRLLRERDGRSAPDIEKVIRWSQQHHFWAPNVLSPGKLREQFGTLWGQMNRPNGAAGKPVEDSASFLARRGG